MMLRLFRTPRKHRTPARELAWLDSGQAFEIEAGGEQLVGWTWGSGPPILLVHGWEGRGSQMGAFVQPLVEAGYQAIAVDAPAHGRSTGKVSSMPQFATTVAALAERFGPLEGIIAHSLGAAASSWAVKVGTRVPKMVFVAPPADINDHVEFFGDLLSLSERSRREMVAYLERHFDVRWDDVRKVTVEPPAADVSLLVIHDDSDRDSPIANGQQVSAAWPGARLVTTSGLGHRRILRDPGVIAHAVRFLTTEIDLPDDTRELLWAAPPETAPDKPETSPASPARFSSSVEGTRTRRVEPNALTGEIALVSADQARHSLGVTKPSCVEQLSRPFHPVVALN